MNSLFLLKDGSTYLAQDSSRSNILSDEEMIGGNDYMICQENSADPDRTKSTLYLDQQILQEPWEKG